MKQRYRVFAFDGQLMRNDISSSKLTLEALNSLRVKFFADLVSRGLEIICEDEPASLDLKGIPSTIIIGANSLEVDKEVVDIARRHRLGRYLHPGKVYAPPDMNSIV